jgi:tRNA-specific 2-thiouridylase
MNGGYEVELVAGEEGVSPGQACVFYDAPLGQARVLGGGFIKNATARPESEAMIRDVVAPPQGIVAGMRG